MSKNNNVNPGQYKVAGRERPGKDVPEPERSKPAPSSVTLSKRDGGTRSSRSSRNRTSNSRGNVVATDE
jgi:hypothetical protein